VTVTIEHLKSKPIEGDAVLWDGTYPQAQSLIAWLGKKGIDAAYSAATPGVPASIEITTADDIPDLYPDTYVLVTVDGAVHLIEDQEAAAFFDESVPPAGLAARDQVKYAGGGDLFEDLRGTVISVYQDGELEYSNVSWMGSDGEAFVTALPSRDLQKQ
jgi:hypothetical protein